MHKAINTKRPAERLHKGLIREKPSAQTDCARTSLHYNGLDAIRYFRNNKEFNIMRFALFKLFYITNYDVINRRLAFKAGNERHSSAHAPSLFTWCRIANQTLHQAQ